VEVQLHAFLTSALVGCEWSASRAGRFIPGVKAPATHFIGGPRAGTHAVAKRENRIVVPCVNWTQVIQPVN